MPLNLLDFISLLGPNSNKATSVWLLGSYFYGLATKDLDQIQLKMI